MKQSIHEWTNKNLSNTAFKKSEVIWPVKTDINGFRFFKDCLPQILLGPFLNT